MIIQGKERRPHNPNERAYTVWKRDPNGVARSIGTVLADSKHHADMKATRLFRTTFVWTTEKEYA